MNNSMAIIKLNNLKKGAFYKIGYVSDVPVTAAAKKAGIVVLKRTIGTYRVGIKYENTKTMQAKIAEGYQPQPRKWGNYLAGSDRIIEYTNKAGQYNLYAALHATPNKSKSTYYVNGKIVKKDELMKSGYVPQSYFNNKDSGGTITVNLNNIESIG